MFFPTLPLLFLTNHAFMFKSRTLRLTTFNTTRTTRMMV